MRIPRSLSPLLLLTISTAALLSGACGLFSAPVDVPKLLFINSRVKVDTDIVDPNHHAVNDVTVTLTKYSKRWTFFWGNVSESKTETLQTGASNFLPIDRYGYYEIDAVFSKPGYSPTPVNFVRGSKPEEYYSGGFMPHHLDRTSGELVDVHAVSRKAIVLTPTSNPTQPAPPPPLVPPTPPNPATPPGVRYETPK